jgi:hypothetical protein
MQPTISRETVLVDRRQPVVRWSAVFAGAACSIGFWMLLQLLGVGIGLSAVDIDDMRSLRGAGVGATVWSLLSPLIAMFFGGMIAGKLAQTHDRKLAGAHGLVMWALTSILGLCATVWIVAMIATGATRHGGAVHDPAGNTMAWANEPADTRALAGLGVDVADLLAPINQRLSSQGKPTITVLQFEAAIRGVVRGGIAGGDFDQELLVDQLVASTRLSRADATDVERQIEARLDTREARAHALEHRVEHAVLGAADATGKALTTVGVSLALGLIASILGALVAVRRMRRDEGAPRRGTRITEPGFSAAEPVMTAPYPTPTAPASPVVPPSDVIGP